MSAEFSTDAEDIVSFHQARGIFPSTIAIAVVLVLFTVPDILATDAPLWVHCAELVSVMLIAGWMALRLSRVGVRVYPGGIVIVNPVRTHSAAWDNIARFTWGRYGLTPKVGAELENGTVLPIYGLLTGGAGPGDSSSTVAMDELNEMLEKYKGEPSPASSH